MLWIVLIVLVLLVVGAVSVYNRLVALRNRTKNAWAQIDVQLKRRHDLIPNLVNTVKGYLTHEREVLENVTRARQQAVTVRSDNVEATAAAETYLTSALRQVFAVAENYPELRANQNMLALQEELTSTENKIAFARQHYNDSVLSYNTARETFPGMLFAGGFAPQQLFEIEDHSERAVPTVSFDSPDARQPLPEPNASERVDRLEAPLAEPAPAPDADRDRT